MTIGSARPQSHFGANNIPDQFLGDERFVCGLWMCECWWWLENDGWASRGSETMATSRYHRRLMLMSSCIEHQRPRWKRYQNRAKAEEKLCKLATWARATGTCLLPGDEYKNKELFLCAFFFSIVLLVLCPFKLRRVQKQQANGLRWTVRCAFAPSSCRTSEIKERQKKNSSEVKKQKEEKKKQFYSIGVRIMRHFGILSGPLIAQLTAESYITHT